MFTPRCPDCDIEMLMAGETFACPLCGGRSTTSYCPSKSEIILPEKTSLWHTLMAARQLLVEAAEECPDSTALLGKAYHLAGEILERLE